MIFRKINKSPVAEVSKVNQECTHVASAVATFSSTVYHYKIVRRVFNLSIRTINRVKTYVKLDTKVLTLSVCTKIVYFICITKKYYK